MLRYLILTAAVSSGGAAAWLTIDGGREPPVDQPVVEAKIAVTDILVAATTISEGGRLSKETVRWQPWPSSAVLPTFITRDVQPNAVEELDGSVVRNPLTESDPITKAKLAPASAGYMSALLPAGKRAIAVKVSAASSAGGFILPNDRVDVLHTVTQTRGEGAATTTRVILGNIRVLAVDQSQIENGDTRQRAVIGQTATLELDLRQVKLLTAAQATGSLTLALRSIADIALDTPSDIEDVEPQVAAVEPKPEPEAKPQKLVVTVSRGGKTETIEVNRHTRVSAQRAY